MVPPTYACAIVAQVRGRNTTVAPPRHPCASLAMVFPPGQYLRRHGGVCTWRSVTPRAQVKCHWRCSPPHVSSAVLAASPNHQTPTWRQLSGSAPPWCRQRTRAPSWRNLQGRAPAWRRPDNRAPTWRKLNGGAPPWCRPRTRAPSWHDPQGITPPWRRPDNRAPMWRQLSGSKTSTVIHHCGAVAVAHVPHPQNLGVPRPPAVRAIV